MSGKIGAILNYLFAAMSMVFGLIYFTKASFMPYHHQALAVDWNDLAPNTKYLILALMRAVSGGFIVSSITIAFLQFRFVRDRLSWIPLLILILGLIIESSTIYAILIVRMNTQGDPPIELTVFGIFLLIAGYFFNRHSYRLNK